ncbi:MAG: chemotaxis protein CheX [Deltaproteobacteria bacterium]|nr:chemotaxis protein CheX [Deltaproteobacteria bacterium]
MNDLPNAATLATLVTNVTKTMFGMSFSLAEENSGGVSPLQALPPWRTVVLLIRGGRPITVAIASDERGGKTLGGAMFSCAPDDVDTEMVDDSLRELVNIVAGQVKSAMGLDQTLGLPKVLELEEATEPAGALTWRGATLRNQEKEVKVWVAITEAVVQ